MRQTEDLLIYPPLLLSAEQDALFITEKGVLRSGSNKPTFLFAQLFHFDAARFSPYQEDNLKGGSELFAVIRCEVIKNEASSLKLSAAIMDRTSENSFEAPVTVISEAFDQGTMALLIKLFIPKVEPGTYFLSLTAKTKADKKSTIFNEFIIN
jgi:hypothetical protein